MTGLPSGTVTFVFTDIEGSTRLLQEFKDAYAEALEQHRLLLREAFLISHGTEVDTQGDALFYAFPTAKDAVLASVQAQRALARHIWPEGATIRVRIGIHTGEPLVAGTGYVGVDVHRGARICAAGHGGQILLSHTVQELVQDELPPGITLRDLGPHRLKDLTRPVHLFQVIAPGLAAEFPSLRTLDSRPHNLPLQLTSFVGREQEIAEIRRLPEATKVLTLTGSGGAGKTRLALQVAAELLDLFPDGVWFVDLAALSDASLLPQAVMGPLGLREQPGQSPQDTLVDFLRPKRLLLLLDNCEHLVQACAGLAQWILRTCPNVRILATSRERLGIAGEVLRRVPSMALPDLASPPPLERLREVEAVRLFLDRATASSQTFQLTPDNAPAVVQVCRRLDGIPLALELAAARITILSAEQIARRLDDRFRLLTGGNRGGLPRHQTLKATLDWSHELLSGSERAMLRRLSVFAGGFTLEAAEAVCAGDDVDESAILDLLGRLADKSLIVAEPHGANLLYRLLETIRQYASDRLAESGEAPSVHRRHFDFFLALAREGGRVLRTGGDQATWLDRLQVEHDNMRAALEWIDKPHRENDRRPNEGLELAVVLSWFWQLGGHVTEGRARIDDALGRAEASAATPLRAAALIEAGRFRMFAGELDGVQTFLQEALEIYRKSGDRPGISRTLGALGNLAMDQGDCDAALSFHNESLAIRRGMNDQWGVSSSLSNLGQAYLAKGDYSEAERFLTESLRSMRELGDHWGVAFDLRQLARVSVARKDYVRAQELITQAVPIYRAIGDKQGLAESFIVIAEVACAKGQLEPAARLLGKAEEVFERVGSRVFPRYRGEHDRAVAAIRRRLDADVVRKAWTEGRRMSLEQATRYALSSMGQ